MPDRTVAPAIQSIEQVSIPEAIRVSLDNHTPLYFINAGKQPVMRLEVIFKAGKWYEPEPGFSYFAGKMLTEGTERYTALEIASLFEELGAFVDVSPGFDRITLTVHLLNRYLSKILPVVREIISNPVFRKSELESIKKRKKQQLLVDLNKNSYVAAREFTRKIFGAQHPYGRFLEINQIDAIDNQSVASYFEKYMLGNIEIIASGCVGEGEIQLINEHLGQQGVNPEKVQPSFPLKYQPTEYFRDKPDSLQSSIRIGTMFIGRDHPDYLNMVVVNEILGGYFGSRLMRNIREDKGYTYGIHSRISSLMNASFWVISTDVKKQFRQHTIDEIHSEILALHNERIPDEELETVKNYMLGTFIATIDSPFALADKFKIIHYAGLNYEYFREYFKSVRGATSQKVRELSGKYFDLKKMTTVVVG